jgi:choline dehydrogenase
MNAMMYVFTVCLLGVSYRSSVSRYHYGAPSDYDEWARITGDESWSYKNIIKYFRKLEKYSPNPNFPLVDMEHRSKTGLMTGNILFALWSILASVLIALKVGHGTYTNPTTGAFVQACHEIGIPVSPDINTSAGTLGATRVSTFQIIFKLRFLMFKLKIMTYIAANGERVTTESAYLTDDVLGRPNLTVVLGANVTRILLESSGKGTRL